MSRRAPLVAALVAAASSVGCHAPQKPPAPEALAPVAARVEPVREVARTTGDDIVGTVRARSVTSLSSSVMGTVRTIKASLGSRVRAGDVVVELLAGEIDASARRADALYAQASLAATRARELRASDTISQAELDAAEAQLRVAEAARAETRAMTGYTVIRAPFAGVVTSKLANVGDLAVPGHPLLTLEDSTALRLEATVPEAASGAIAVGDPVPVHVDAAGGDVEGRVAEVSPSADPASHTFLVKVDLPANPALRTGMFGRLRMKGGEKRALAMPASALVRRGQLELAYVVDPSNVARLRLVRTGRASGSSLEVLAGLDAGERVVASETTRLVDGQPVEVAP